VQVLQLVELEPIRGNIVGKPGESGLSVEQRKRLTIAVELVANPSIVFMDEPTSGAHHATSSMSVWSMPIYLIIASTCHKVCRPLGRPLQCKLLTGRMLATGLDARAAAIVMRTVRNTVNTGRTVVCTIHQPSIDIFEVCRASRPNAVPHMPVHVKQAGTPETQSKQATCRAFCSPVQAFDDLLLMKAGGMITYHGHLGKRSHALVTYFEVGCAPCKHRFQSDIRSASSCPAESLMSRSWWQP
jgi:hypothetical protein